jgi:hypothetical protein
MTTRRRKKHRPQEIVAKLRDAGALRPLASFFLVLFVRSTYGVSLAATPWPERGSTGHEGGSRTPLLGWRARKLFVPFSNGWRAENRRHHGPPPFSPLELERIG